MSAISTRDTEPTSGLASRRVSRLRSDCSKKCAEADPFPEDGRTATILVLDDGNQGFGHYFEKDSWPKWVPKPADEGWVILKWARPALKVKDPAEPKRPAESKRLPENGLWRHLESHYAERLVVVFTANDLRLTGMQISRELSWERTAQDVVREITGHQAFSRCSTIVVSFHTAGAIVCSRKGSSWDNMLYFDPSGIEGEWFMPYQGKMAGYTQCFVAGIAHGLWKAGNLDGLAVGVRSGLVASRILHEEGFGVVGTFVGI
jgi:hypothetical protein